MSDIQNKPGLLSRSYFNMSGFILPSLIFLIAAAVRFIPYDHVFSAGRIYLYDPDCYVRLRKILVYLQSFPTPSVYDYFEAFPKGTGIISPPTMEYLVAAVAYPFRSSPNLVPILKVFVAFVPVIIGAATTVMMYWWVCRYFGRMAAVTASLVLALYPPFVDATVLGRFDNEMLEPFLLLATFWLYVTTYEDEFSYPHWSAVGIMSVLYLSIWRGATFPLAIVGIDMLIRIISNRHDPKRAMGLGKAGSFMYLVAAGTIALICVTNVWDTRSTFSFNIISWFHAVLFGAAAAVLFFTSAVVTWRTRSKTRLTMLGYFALAIVMVTLLMFLIREVWQGLKVVGGGNIWVDSISQYRRGASLNTLLFFYGGLFFAMPFMLIVFRSFIFKRVIWLWFVTLWTLVMIVAAVARVRYAGYVGLNMALLSGMTVYYTSEKLKDNVQSLGRTAKYAVAAAIIVLQIPTYQFFASLSTSGASFSIKGDIEETMLWLRDNTPSAGDPYRPYIKPSYGVLSRWDYGGWIEAIAERPTLATTFGTEAYGMEELSRFFLSATEDDMETILRKNSIRYIIVDKMTGDLPMYARLLGQENTFFDEQWDPRRKTTVYLPNKSAFGLIVSRLFFADGSMRSAGDFLFQPVEGVRLIYESPSPATVFGFPWEIKKMKVFEYAEGASIVIYGTAGNVVTVSQKIETNQGRKFMYVNEKICNGEGVARFKLLYANKKMPQSTGAIEPVLITSNGKKREIPITDQDIEAQKTIKISL